LEKQTSKACKRRWHGSEDLRTFGHGRCKGEGDGFLAFLWSFAERDEDHSICAAEWFREALGKVRNSRISDTKIAEIASLDIMTTGD
jgi:hypothetical protein